MAVETSTEKKICGSCGADVRPNTTFCYNCGASVTENSVLKIEKPIDDGKSVSLQPEIADNQNGRNSDAGIAAPVIDKPIEKPFTESLETKKEAAKIDAAKSESKDNPPLRTAASMRRPSKSGQPKNIEVIWEQPQNSTSIWFVVFAFVLILLAAGALLTMLYLK